MAARAGTLRPPDPAQEAAMALDIGVLMDPIGSIKTKKDSTFAMLLEARRRGHRLHYLGQGDLAVRDGRAIGRCADLQVREDPADWFTLGTPAWHRPQSLRDANEKLYAQWFPQCSPPTLVAREPAALRAFVQEVGDAVLKPLDGMGGRGIFKTRGDDPNLNVILETLTHEGTELAMAQRFVPEAALGDKRILLIDGEPVPYALARIPQGTDFRGNMARGGKAVGQPLSDRDRWICEQVAPQLRARGLWFVGLDVIGDYLTEINVTSPTGIRELDAQFGLNIAGLLFDRLEALRAEATR